MNTPSDNFFSFIETNKTADVAKLRLKYAGRIDADIDYDFAITQIECRQRFGKKIADILAASPRWLFADSLSGEQSTSEHIAAFHASLVPQGATVVDMTAGLGIDVIHIAGRASQVTAVERDQRRAEVLEYNVRQLGINNLTVICGDSVELLNAGKLNADIVMIDPARRDAVGGRVYALGDCEPNLIALMPTLQKHFNSMIAKLSPMLDVTQTIRELPSTRSIWAVGTAAECSELSVLTHLNDDNAPVAVHALTLLRNGGQNDFVATLEDINEAPATPLGVVHDGNIIYEPWPTVMKTGAFRVVAQRFAVQKLHDNTHLFFSEHLLPDFPGEARRVVKIVPWQSKYLKRFKNEFPNIDVTVRNFGMSADALRSKLGVKPGGKLRLYGVTDATSRRLIVTEPIS